MPGIYIQLIPGLTVADTYFSTQQMKPNMYLQPIPYLAIAGTNFSHQKYKAGHIPETWPVADTLLPT